MIPVAVEPDESPLGGKDEALIRKPSRTAHGNHQGGNHDEMLDDLDEMIFGKKNDVTSEQTLDTKKQHPAKDDLITF